MQERLTVQSYNSRTNYDLHKLYEQHKLDIIIKI